MSIHHAARAFAGALIMAVCAFGQFALDTNTNPPATTTTSSFPPIGIGTTETAQVILINTATGFTAGGASTSTSAAPSPSCNGSVAFYNASGAIIGSATSFTLTSGQIAQVSIPYASTSSASVRELIRAVVSLNIAFPPAAPCALSYSLATFDIATGATHAIVSGAGISGIVTPVTGHI